MALHPSRPGDRRKFRRRLSELRTQKWRGQFDGGFLCDHRAGNIKGPENKRRLSRVPVGRRSRLCLVPVWACRMVAIANRGSMVSQTWLGRQISRIQQLGDPQVLYTPTAKGDAMKRGAENIFVLCCIAVMFSLFLGLAIRLLIGEFGPERYL